MFLREARRVAALIVLIISVVAQEKNTAEEIRKLKLSDEVYFIETFNDKDIFLKKWSASSAKKEVSDGSVMKYEGDWVIDSANKDPLSDDLGLTFKEKAKHRAISVKLKKDFTFKERPLILQYEVLHQEGQECGGAYLKLISNERLVASLSNFNDKTPYTIMFGPDKCGNQHKLHFIFRHKNPVTGTFEEKHCKQPKSRIDEVFTDGKPHLFKLLLTPDNAYKIFVDNNLINSGSLLEDFSPPVNPPAEIDDPADLKPADWDDKEKIPDPSAKKPEEWDEEAPYQIEDPAAVRPDDWLENEPENIRDPSAVKPDDWEDEMDGEWEAPLVPNPACEGVAGCGPWSAPLINNPSYKGVWSPPLIDNPNYKGQWKPKKIHNPNYFEDKQPFAMTQIDALGFELWSMTAGILFDNIILTHSNDIAQKFSALTYEVKMQFIEKSSETFWAKLMVLLNNRPGWWSLYFVYCLIPIAIYVWYIWNRVHEDTFLNKFIAFTNEYPWLWALYVVILLIPVTLIVVCCFWTRKDTIEDPKKNDDFEENMEDYSETCFIADSSDKPTKEEAPKENDLLNLDVSDLHENEQKIEKEKNKKSNDESESSSANLSVDDKVEADNPAAEITDVDVEKGESSSGEEEEEDDENLEEVTEVGSTIRKRK